MLRLHHKLLALAVLAAVSVTISLTLASSLETSTSTKLFPVPPQAQRSEQPRPSIPGLVPVEARAGQRSINQSTDEKLPVYMRQPRRTEGGVPPSYGKPVKPPAGPVAGAAPPTVQQAPKAMQFYRPVPAQEAASVPEPLDYTGSPFQGEAAMATVDWPLLSHLESAVEKGTLVNGDVGGLTPSHPGADPVGPVSDSVLKKRLSDDAVAASQLVMLSSKLVAPVVVHAAPAPGSNDGKDILRAFLASASELAEHLSTPRADCHPVLVLGSGNGHLSALLARVLSSTVVSVVQPSQSKEGTLSNLDNHIALKALLGIRNNPVCEATIGPGLISRISKSGQEFSAVVVQHLKDMVADTLPHEFEALLGNILKLSRFTVLELPLPDTQYFSYWESATDLVRAAAASAGLVTIHKELSDGGSSGWNAPPAKRMLLVTARTVSEAALEAALNKRMDDATAALNAKEDSEEGSDAATRVVKALSKSPAPTTKHPKPLKSGLLSRAKACAPPGVGLSTLLSMGLSQEDAQQLFTMLLEAPDVSPDISRENVRWHGKRVVTVVPPPPPVVNVTAAEPSTLPASAAPDPTAPPRPASKGAKAASVRDALAAAATATKLAASRAPPPATKVPVFNDATDPVGNWMPPPPPKLKAKPHRPVVGDDGTLPVKGASRPAAVVEDAAALEGIDADDGALDAAEDADDGAVPEDDGDVVPLFENPLEDDEHSEKLNAGELFDGEPDADDGVVGDADTDVAGDDALEGADTQTNLWDTPGGADEGLTAPDDADVVNTPPAADDALLDDTPPTTDDALLDDTPPTTNDIFGDTGIDTPDDTFTPPDDTPDDALTPDDTPTAPEDTTTPEDTAPPPTPDDKPPAPAVTVGRAKAPPKPKRPRVKKKPPPFDTDETGQPGGLRGGKSPTTRRLLGVLTEDADIATEASLAHAAADVPEAAEALQKRSREGPRNNKWAASKGSSQTGMVGREATRFGRFWRRLRAEISGTVGGEPRTQHTPSGGSSVLVSGKGTGLVSVKLARAFPDATVVSLKASQSDVSAHLSLVELLGVRNNLVGVSRLTSSRVAALNAANDPFRFQVISVDVFEGLLLNTDSLDDFEAHLGQLLRLATTTFIELPDWNRLLQAVRLLGGSSVSRFAAHRSKAGLWDGSDDGTHAEDVVLGTVSQSAGGPPHRAPAEGGEEDMSAAGIAERYDPGGVAAAVDGVEVRPFMAMLTRAAAAGGFSGGQVSARFLDVAPEGTAPRGSADSPLSDALSALLSDFDSGLGSKAPSPSASPSPPPQTPAGKSTTRLVRVDAFPWSRLPARGAPPVSPVVASGGSAPVAPRAGVSLHTLLTLGVVPSMRAELFQLYLSLPLLDITRAAVAFGYSYSPEEEAEAASPLTMSPWAVRYHHGGHLGGRLVVTVGPHGTTDPSAVRQFATDDVFSETAGPESSPVVQAVLEQFTATDTACGGGPGRFSVLEYGSGVGTVSVELATRFPQATVVSVEGDKQLSRVHLSRLDARNITNNYICNTAPSPSLMSKIYESPEFFRFQVLSGNLVHLLKTHTREGLGKLLGKMVGLSATSVVTLPTPTMLSLAFTTFFYTYPDPTWYLPPPEHASGGSVRSPAAGAGLECGQYASYRGLGGDGNLNAAQFVVAAHPRPAFSAADVRLLQGLVVAGGNTRVGVTPVTVPLREGTRGGTGAVVDTGVVRVDLKHVVREVNHHFESHIDGHERKYTLKVDHNDTASDALASGEPVTLELGNHPNNGGVVAVRLVRKGDKSLIPYVTVHGITLIAMLRMGLAPSQKVAAYHKFVSLPLYQDMAPWNIVFVGPGLDYIDFDTKDHTYDAFVPKAYETMEVLFNYKRTVEDFGRCNSKGSNPYGFPFVSDCVGGHSFMGPCKNSSLPVPCGDGTCQSDYVSCLRAMSTKELREREERHLASRRVQATEDAVRTKLWGLPFGGGGGAAGSAVFSHEWTFGRGGKVEDAEADDK